MTDKELETKINKESNDFRILGMESKLAYIFDRLAEILIQLHELRKRLAN